jgi:hypothetical protein
MKHVFGMAKSPLDGGGAKGRNLELDFLRLLYAVEHFRAAGNEAQGYLLVLAEPLRTRISKWVKKYDAMDCVELIVATLDESQTRLLSEEKIRNRLGNAKGADRSLASAAYGKRLGEEALRAHILASETGVSETMAGEVPFGVAWDFYGVVIGPLDHPNS